jgi:hypothetical protein
MFVGGDWSKSDVLVEPEKWSHETAESCLPLDDGRSANKTTQDFRESFCFNRGAKPLARKFGTIGLYITGGSQKIRHSIAPIYFTRSAPRRSRGSCSREFG